MVAALVGRTVSSADAIQNCALIVTNDDATYLIKRPRDQFAAETAAVIQQTQNGDLTGAYHALCQTIRKERTKPPFTPPYNFSVNRWSVYSPGTTYFVPVMDVTRFYINGIMEMFDEGMDLYLVDERAGFRPAGLRSFGQSKGGPLHDDPRDQKMGTIAQTETVIAEMIAIEVGMMLQNIHLIAQAIGLIGWPNFARHESGWFEALGFNMASMPSTSYLGASAGISLLSKLAGKTVDVKYPMALEVDGKPLLTPYCPPYSPTMRDAVYAVANEKFGPQGTFRGDAAHSAWQDPTTATGKIAAPKTYVIEATAAYCDYIYQTYGRFPAYLAPYRTLLGTQVSHLDTDFYDQFFKPDALTVNQRKHYERWHSNGNTDAPI